ncbi:MAG: isocitrate lyase/phosphoenolpyruvate mutase family protein, partial [Pseudomonadota bacterium]
MSQTDRTHAFAALHVPGEPVILYNVWDAATARAVTAAGAQAIATASHAVAEAHGFEDGEEAPLDFVLPLLERIASSTERPVTMDAESGYAADPDGVAANISRYLQAGAVGVNVEDSVIGKDTLYSTSDQSARLAAIHAMATAEGVPLFLNARTDVFLRASKEADPASLVEEVLARADAYAAAGASGLFVPGLRDLSLLERIARDNPLPVNAYRPLDGAPISDYASAGVARISHGPGPFNHAMKMVEAAASDLYRA